MIIKRKISFTILKLPSSNSFYRLITRRLKRTCTLIPLENLCSLISVAKQTKVISRARSVFTGKSQRSVKMWSYLFAILVSYVIWKLRSIVLQSPYKNFSQESVPLMKNSLNLSSFTAGSFFLLSHR